MKESKPEIEEKPENEENEEKEPTEEELAQKKKDEEEAEKQVPTGLIDSKAYFNETEETFIVYEDAKIGHIISHIKKNDFDCIMLRPTDISTT